MTEEKQFLTKSKFTRLIEDAVVNHRVSYMDAVIQVCEDNNVEIEEVRRFISPSIKEKIEAEARNLNFLPKLNTLPVD